MATKASGGGTPDLFSVLEVLGYVGIYGCRRYVGGPKGGPRGRGRTPTLVGASGLFWPISDTPWASSGPKIISVKFQVNWTPFGFPFLRYSKTRKNINWHWHWALG